MSVTNIELSTGQYLLTPLESIFINKIMPKNFKFESEENLEIIIDPINNFNKFRHSLRNKQNHNNNNLQINNISKESKNIILPKKLYISQKQCKIFLEKLKNFSYIDIINNNQSEPSLKLIESKINNNKYRYFSDFANDIRRLWSFYFNKYSTDGKIYRQIYKIWEYSEKMIKFFRNKNGNFTMSYEEKKELINLIRALNKEQLRGIIKLLNPQNKNVAKSFEFDLDALTPKKLKELNEYVKNCIYGEDNVKNGNIKLCELKVETKNKINED